MTEQELSLRYFLNRMKDIRAAYLDVINYGSVAMLHAVVDSQRPQDVPVVSDRDIQLMQWIVRTGIIHDSPLGTKDFLTFLIQLKGASEAKELKWLMEYNQFLLESWESLWLLTFKNQGSLKAAKEKIVLEFGWLIESDESKKIINTSYQTAKQKWATIDQIDKKG